MAVPKTYAELEQIVNANIPDNQVGDVTEPKMRLVLLEIITRVFQIKNVTLGSPIGGLRMTTEGVLSNKSSGFVVQQPSGEFEQFNTIHQALGFAGEGDFITVNQNVSINATTGPIVLKNGVNVDFRFHDIVINDIAVGMQVVGDGIVSTVFNIGSVRHNFGGDYSLYSSTEENCILKVYGNNCYILMSGNEIYSARAGVVFLYGDSSVVHVDFKKIYIASFGVKDQASFYVTSENEQPFDEAVQTKSIIRLKSESLVSASEVCFMADVDAIIHVDVKVITLNASSLLAIQKFGRLVFIDCDVTAEETCMIVDSEVSSSKVSIIRFEGKNVLRTLATSDARAGFPVIALKAKESIIENYGSLRIAQPLPYSGHEAIGVNPTAGSPSVFANNSYIFNMGTIGTVFPINAAILRKGFFGATYILQNNSFGEH